MSHINRLKVLRVLEASDTSLYEIIPEGVLFPKNADDVKNIIIAAVNTGVTVHPRGTGTSTAGQSLGNGIVLDFSKYMKNIVAVGNDYVDVEPGLILGKLNSYLEKRNVFIPVDPSSAAMCSVGGMVSNNASGIHSFLY
ncbi:MAG: FAD-binding oxidoreductase, partial [Pseudomonadota bacterium]